jgi:hypothetical protein
MTSQEWQAASEPQAMLEFLARSGRTSERKLRLFAVACSRRVWSLIDAPGRAAIEVAERFADGLVGPYEMRAARLACRGAGGQAAWYAAATRAEIAARNAARSAQSGAAEDLMHDSEAAELAAQAELLRDIFGPNAVTSSSGTASWLTPDLVELAQAIYEERAFDRTPILADALEKAGCDNAEVVCHLRGPGPHVRGCWALDLILRK